MFGNVYGLDLGTYEIKVYDKKNNSIWKEKNAIAIANEKEIFSIGDAAYAMYEKAPESINVIFPVVAGVIADYNILQKMIFDFLETKFTCLVRSTS